MFSPGQLVPGWQKDLQERLDEEGDSQIPHGHITSLAVSGSYRKMGLAEKLMSKSLDAMAEHYGAQYVTLHVRKSNLAAIHLYKDILKFRESGIEEKYYADGEDAIAMKKMLSSTMIS